MVNNDRGRERQMSRDRETIRNWADSHEVVPVRESGTGEGDRFRMVPEDRMESTHERLEWDAFFEDFEGGDRVVVYHGEDASDPFEVTGHADLATELDEEDLEERLLEGETVRSTVTETAVVESVVTEELTVESELIDHETVEQRVVDTELVSRSSTGCRLTGGATGTMDAHSRDDSVVGDDDDGLMGDDDDGLTDDDRNDDTILDDDESDAGPLNDESGDLAGDDDEWFDTDRYLESVGGQTASAPGGDATGFEGRSLPYGAELDIEERWNVTRALTERYVVESEIVGAEVSGAESLEDYDLDVQGLHRTIAESGIIEEDLATEDFLSEHDLESELTEDDRVTTTFTRERRVEDEIIDRKVVDATLTGREVRDIELVETHEMSTAERGPDAGTTGTSGMAGESGEAGASGDVDATGAGIGNSPGGATDSASVSDDDVGKTVVDPTGDEIGVITAVDEDAHALYVDPEPGMTDRIKSALGWGDADEDDQRLDAAHVDQVTDDEVHLDDRQSMGDRDSTGDGDTSTMNDPTSSDDRTSTGDSMASNDPTSTDDSQRSTDDDRL